MKVSQVWKVAVVILKDNNRSLTIKWLVSKQEEDTRHLHLSVSCFSLWHLQCWWYINIQGEERRWRKRKEICLVWVGSKGFKVLAHTNENLFLPMTVRKPPFFLFSFFSSQFGFPRKETNEVVMKTRGFLPTVSILTSNSSIIMVLKEMRWW